MGDSKEKKPDESRRKPSLLRLDQLCHRSRENPGVRGKGTGYTSLSVIYFYSRPHQDTCTEEVPTVYCGAHEVSTPRPVSPTLPRPPSPRTEGTFKNKTYRLTYSSNTGHLSLQVQL